ncbi:WGR domain-containing protein [Rhizobium johnstonii]|uniref:WGR domain-containing protein n=1 Tax=Rhizobium johnstonii (strain DSM 114642 / LMG 32736 / 3841) TaxID=216596 RepID=Q1M3Q0_RHIJ3|nr:MULTISPECIES: WGR domain-containing protein [Rhizobium]NEI93711.1 WGR domain-containing protein [Rhizobium leguminosarum]NEJ80002.1 WGR domain-containing protein [Rhizobium leguminosarum]TBF27753.1 WGR domain-containing protein [Rhizobium leguminosarum]TBF46854.1 WGR domain-containing protein [Rhizobium leguminosarum]TBF48513.1 WGR domain-containing protein [Rhizobium leguminosarum]
MTREPYRLYIERIDPSKNMARYYALSIEPNLFGGTSLVRSWGRIGSRGQQKIHVFDSEAKAVDLLLTLLRKKRSRGYRVMR